jgi:hypothetical protein
MESPRRDPDSQAAGRWLNLKVMHDTGAGMINIYENDKLVKTIPDRGGWRPPLQERRLRHLQAVRDPLEEQSLLGQG